MHPPSRIHSDPEGVDYQWQRSWRRGDYWVQKDEWAKELVEAEAIYSGLPAKAVIEPAVVEKSRAVTRPAASHKTSKTKPQPRRPRSINPTIVYPPVEQEDRCVFHSVAMNMGGYFLNVLLQATRPRWRSCRFGRWLPRRHEDDPGGNADRYGAQR